MDLTTPKHDSVRKLLLPRPLFLPAADRIYRELNCPAIAGILIGRTKVLPVLHWTTAFLVTTPTFLRSVTHHSFCFRVPTEGK